MTFSDRDKAKALAIVKIFETGKPFGNYSAVAVLSDGAGISYGTSQFTHRSGSLAAVVRRYAKLKGGSINVLIASALPDFQSGRNIPERSADKGLKKALYDAGSDPLMQQAQREIAFENYLQPALVACEGSDFVFPLSLAVIYDSKNHGGYDTVRDRTHVEMPGNGSMKPEEFEREWITEYCKQRKKWLKSSKKPVVRATVYRPDFFLGEIARGNWGLDLPLNVHGHKLTEAMLFPKSSAADAPVPESILTSDELKSANVSSDTQKTPDPQAGPSEEAQPPINPGDPVSIATPQYQGVGLLGALKKDFAAVTGGNVSFQMLQEYATQASGWPPWVVSLLTKIATIVIILSAVWLLYRFAHYIIWKLQLKGQQTLEATIKSDPNLRDVEFK